MSTPYDPTRPEPARRDPIPEVPGLEDVIRALTAEGDATELTGRQAALTMFRAARDQPAGSHYADQSAATTQVWSPQQAFGQPAPAPDPGGHRPGQHREAQRRHARGPAARHRRFPALAATAAAIVMACAGVTAAAYAQILPTPIQDIAHRVLAPIGVPSASPVPVAIPTTSSPSSPNAPSPSPTALPVSATSSPGATATVVTAG